MKTTIHHPIYGRFEYDDVINRVSGERRELAEQVAWLLEPENDRLLGHGYWPSRFCRACEVLGLMQGDPKLTTRGERRLPPGTVY
jgi:hypothetical protein